MRPAVLSLAILAVLLAGCEAVPNLTFVDDAGIADGGDQDADGAALDGSDDGADAGVICVGGIPPPGATGCCGTLPCAGGNCNSVGNCSKCDMQMCGGDKPICCVRGGVASCIAQFVSCP